MSKPEMTNYNRYLGVPSYQHDMPPTLGILLANLGTPNAPTSSAVRPYLREFFDDPRVFEFPRLFWFLLTRAIILRTRPRRSAKLYKSIWTELGSPLLVNSANIRTKLESTLQQRTGLPIRVSLGMRYGSPSIFDALEELRRANTRKLLILTLFPQYSATTVASIFDRATQVLQRWRWLPDLRMVTHYHDDARYLAALAESVRNHWAAHGQAEKLVMSFHGIPKRYFTNGDPYYCECHKTARLLAEALQLPKDRYVMAFQSRFGREEWLQPYTSQTLEALAQAGVKSVDVISPGFAADCLETLEEIAGENKEIFLHAGGKEYRYIPALNDDQAHIEALAGVAMREMHGWLALVSAM
ncbi:MAG: ferrochelatase [Anaerolineae bacterium]